MTIELEGPINLDDDCFAFAPVLSAANGGAESYDSAVSVSGSVTVDGNIESSSEEPVTIDGDLTAKSLSVYGSTIEISGKLDVQLLCATGDDTPGSVVVGAASEIPLVFRLWGHQLEGPITGTLFDWDDEDNTEEQYEALAEAFDAIGLELSDEVSLDDVINLVEEDKVGELVAYFEEQ